MSDRLAEIQRALDGFRMEDARELVALELEETPARPPTFWRAGGAESGAASRYLEKGWSWTRRTGKRWTRLADIKRPDKVAPEPPPVADVPVEAPVPVQVKLAPLFKRFIAIVIDGFNRGHLFLAVLFAAGPFAALSAAMAGTDLDAINTGIAQFQSEALPVNLAVSAVYNVVLMTLFNGQTLGKMIFGMRVIRRTAGASACWTRCCATCWVIWSARSSCWVHLGIR